MALRQDRVARTTQPQGEVGLDPDHWLTPWVRQGVLAGPVRNATRDGRYTTATALQKGVTSQPGVAIELTGSGGYIASPSVANASAWTLISYGVARSLASTCAIATMAEAPGNSTADRALYLVASTGVVGAYVYDGANKSISSSAAVDIDTPTFVAAVGAGSTIGAYCKGVLATTATSNSGYTAYATPELVHGYGGGVLGSGATNPSAWSAYYTLLIRRALTLAELRELEENPWAILAPDVVEWMLSTGGSSTNLTVSDAAHAHAADSLTLTTASTLAIADATHAHAADALTLVTGSALVVADAAHGHASDAVTVSVQSSLAVADAAHAHAADAPALTVQSALVVADASHGHAAEAPALAVQSVLAVADAAHAHAADNVTLAVAGATTLAVADATHAHTVDGLTLTAASVLAVQEALHAHAADGITLDAGGATNLLLADSLHAHTSDGLALVVDAWLVVADAGHGHRADSVVLTLPGEVLPGTSRYTITARARRLQLTAAPRRLEITR